MRLHKFPLPKHDGLPWHALDPQLEYALFDANDWQEVAQRIRQSNLRLAIRLALLIAEGHKA
jgi:hypothetical protein